MEGKGEGWEMVMIIMERKIDSFILCVLVFLLICLLDGWCLGG